MSESVLRADGWGLTDDLYRTAVETPIAKKAM